MVDLTEFDNLADKQIKAGNVKMSFASVLAIITFISTVVAGLYGGFVMYQKIEEVAGLDLSAYQQQMDVMDAKVSGISDKVEESVEYTRDIKNGLKDDLLRIEQQTDRVEDMVRDNEDKVRKMIDDAEVRFENQRERVRVSQSGSMKELEDKLMDKLQRALDNPLADQETNMNWIKDRLKERTTWDGVALCGLGVIVILLPNSIDNIAAGVAIAWGAWTTLKNE